MGFVRWGKTKPCCGAGFFFFCIFAVMDFIKDIFINLLSDVIWAGIAFAYFAILKKSSLSSYRIQSVLKKLSLFFYREQPILKKSFSCDLLLKSLKSN